MKRRLLVCLVACVMALSFAVPAMAAEVASKYTVVEEEVAPRSDMTQIYFRTYNGRLQFRVWSITNGRWLTEWTNV